MAGIYIPGMEIPKKGQMLVIFPDGTAYVCFNGMRERLAQAEIVPVPEHGRLIDADRFEKANAYYWGRDFIGAKYEDCLCDLVNAAPTIIPASEEGEK